MTPPTAATPAPPNSSAIPKRRIKPSCERCYFGRRGLCALELDEPCPTFRPDSPNGLVPPWQPTLLLGADTGDGAVAATERELATAA